MAGRREGEGQEERERRTVLKARNRCGIRHKVIVMRERQKRAGMSFSVSMISLQIKKRNKEKHTSITYTRHPCLLLLTPLFDPPLTPPLTRLFDLPLTPLFTPLFTPLLTPPFTHNFESCSGYAALSKLFVLRQ